jgi:indolepyruvate ferredoxin oxidoreductase beta subunit
MTGPINVFITGVGGQGVITLAHALRQLCDRNDLRTTGAVLKGGAQRLGTVSASLRIFDSDCANYRDYSIEIPQGRLHLMIGLEPWECLRAARLCGNGTKVVVNRAEVPLLAARTRHIDIIDPLAELAKLDIELEADDFDRVALEEFGERKMVNYVMGRTAIRTALPQFRLEQFEQCFTEVRASVQAE